MRVVTYYRSALLFPVILPLLLAGCYAITHTKLAMVPLVVLGGALLYAGLAYLGFAAAMLWWSRGRSANAMQLAALVSPILFAPLAGLSMVWVEAGFRSSVQATTFWQDVGAGAVLALEVGYAYVALTFVGDRLLRHFGVVRPEDVGTATAPAVGA